MAEGERAAIFRVEGTLVRRPSVAAAAWMAANAQAIPDRLAGLGSAAVAAGMHLGAPLRERPLTQRLTWMGLRGMSRDRLEVLGRDYYDAHVAPNRLDVGVELLREARERGHRIVLVGEGLEVVLRHLAEDLRADELVANALEVRGDRATGRLREPVIGEALSGQWARRWAAERAVDLDASAAYGARRGDGLLLSAIGRPCAVRPDRGLRRLARDMDWPVVEG